MIQMKGIEPLIKWSGSKRSQASAIASYIRKDYGIYHEPFCGSCAMLAFLLSNLPDRFSGFVCSDLNSDLINSYVLTMENPAKVVKGYSERWHELNDGRSIDRKREYFESVRERLNREHDPLDFIFVMRTTTNGMPRYNRNGDFNNSFHITRNGINPETFSEIVNRWSSLLNKYNVEFRCRSFEETHPNENDLVYLDPPYAATKGMYFGGFDSGSLFKWMEGLPCDWMMSYDGLAGKQDLTAEVPSELYRSHVYLENGNSSFRRVIGKDRHCNIRESLYLSFDGGKETEETRNLKSTNIYNPRQVELF